MNCSTRSLLTASACLILLALCVPPMANPQETGPAGQFDILAPLKAALSSAGATALSSTQEASINALISNFRASQTPPTPSEALQAARTSYDNAVLTVDESKALAQVDTIAEAMAGESSTRLKATTPLIISIVKVLDVDQLSALVKLLGTNRTVREIERLAGGPGRGPGFGPGRGPMGGGPPPMDR